MILKETKLKIADNSGGLMGYCIHIYQKQTNQLGNFVKLVLKKIDSRKKVHKKKKYLGLVITCKQQKRRKNGISIKFSENRALLFMDKNKFLGSRIHSPISRELKKKLTHQKANKLGSSSGGFL